MAKAEQNMIFDGQEYKAGDELPDLGSLECVEAIGNIRRYEGLQQDASKLPKYVATGSSCLMLDSGNLYKFHKPTNTWRIPGEG